MNHPRKVKVFKFDNASQSKVEDGIGTFHGWGSDFVEFESGGVSFTTAIIEREDGTIETPGANYIRFIEDDGDGSGNTFVEYLKARKTPEAREEYLAFWIGTLVDRIAKLEDKNV